MMDTPVYCDFCGAKLTEDNCLKWNGRTVNRLQYKDDPGHWICLDCFKAVSYKWYEAVHCNLDEIED